MPEFNFATHSGFISFHSFLYDIFCKIIVVLHFGLRFFERDLKHNLSDSHVPLPRPLQLSHDYIIV